MFVEKEVNNVYINPHTRKKNGWWNPNLSINGNDTNASKRDEKSDQILMHKNWGKNKNWFKEGGDWDNGHI